MYDTVVTAWESHLVFLLLLLGTQALFTGLAAINVRYARETVRERAEWLADTLGIGDTDELLAYHRLTTSHSQLSEWMSLAGLLLILYLGGLTGAVDALERLETGPVLTGVLFFTGFSLLAIVARLPFDIVSTFGIEQAFGFNRSTPRL